MSARRTPCAPSEEARQRFVAFSVLPHGYDSAEPGARKYGEPYLGFPIPRRGERVTGALLSKRQRSRTRPGTTPQR